MIRRLVALLSVLSLFALAGSACRSTLEGPTTDGGNISLGAPLLHRPAAIACDPMRAPGYSGGGADAGFPGSCGSDADCTNGKNGRCTFSRVGHMCNYDACLADGDCAGGKSVCLCGAVATPPTTRSPHTCIASNCLIDTDCPSGYCSPSYDPQCGEFFGYTGFHCHTAQDTCTNDSDCTPTDAAFQGPGYCAFFPETGHWACSYSHCAG